MTTTVTIAAHLSTEKEVRVKITDNGSTVERPMATLSEIFAEARRLAVANA